jgi:O-antigen ligase
MGPGTFSPAKYFYLDNQFLGTLVELGGFGALTMVALFVGALVVAGQARRLSGLEEDRLFARALSAGILSGFVTFATFDALSFPVMSGLMFLYVGMVGSLYRLNRQAADDRANRARVASPDSEDVEAAAATT